MASYMMGRYYEMPKRGNGVSITVKNYLRTGHFHIHSLTKKSALELKRDFKAEGVNEEDIVIEKNRW